jgi:hypothetical protein
MTERVHPGHEDPLQDRQLEPSSTGTHEAEPSRVSIDPTRDVVSGIPDPLANPGAEVAPVDRLFVPGELRPEEPR